MKKTIVLYFLTLILISCVNKKENKSDLELEILNETLIAFPYDLKKDTINILNYSIKNNSDYIYYLKQGSGHDLLYKKIYKNGVFIGIYESNNKEVICTQKMPFEHQNKSDCDSCNNFIQSMKLLKEVERLREDNKMSYYSTKEKRHYLFIHPKEKLFFKQYVNLTDSLRYEDTRFNYAHLKKNIKYLSKFFIPIDSTGYKKELPTDILQTIKANNAKVYHGIIESKNSVPVKVVE